MTTETKNSKQEKPADFEERWRKYQEQKAPFEATLRSYFAASASERREIEADWDDAEVTA